MDIKGIGNKIEGAGGRFVRWFTRMLNRPLVAKIAGRLVRFGLGYLISGGVILSGWSPFGLAFAASMGVGEGAMFGVVGVMLGYFRIMSQANGLKYIAICILIYTAGFVFRGTSIVKRSWFMPLSAAVCTAAIGFVFVADAGFPAAETAFFVTEVLIVSICTHLYQYYFNGDLERVGQPGAAFRAMSLIVLIASCIIPLSRVGIIGDAHLGQALAVFFTMLCGYYGGVGVGSAAGVMLGLAVGVAAGAPEYCAIYGFSGVAGGIFAKKGRLMYTVAYLVANAGAMFWVTAGTSVGALYEAFFASVFFLLSGEMLSGYVPVLESAREGASKDCGKRVRDFTRDRLLRASRAFGELGEMLGGALAGGSGRSNENNIATVFNHPAQNVCRKCQLSCSCWEKDYISTKDALNGVSAVMGERGRLEAADLPLHFTSRCIHLEEFINQVNRELVAFKYRRQFRSRIVESRRIICRQYREMSQVFDRMSREVDKQPRFDLRGEERIRKLLSDARMSANVCVYRDGANHVVLQLEGANIAEVFQNTREYMEKFSNALGVALAEPEKQADGHNLKLTARQREPLSAAIGSAVHRKRDSDMSGDSGSYFKLEDGRLCVILSDGMGSGKEAAKESAGAVRMLERFLRAGIDPALSLATVNSALVIKNAELGGFATLDLLCVDMFTGECELYKYGSAPTYIKRGRHVRRIVSAALPVGIASAAVEKTRVKLHYGDTVVLATDGAADVSDDGWLQTLLSEFESGSAKELAGQLMNSACSRYGKADDMTIMAIHLEKNV